MNLFEPGRPLTRDTTTCFSRGQVCDLAKAQHGGRFGTSPFSKGTMREYSVVQIWSSSCCMRALGCFPNLSMHSRFESGVKINKLINRTILISASFILKNGTLSESGGLNSDYMAGDNRQLGVTAVMSHLSELSHRN